MKIFQAFVFRRAGDPACRLGEGYSSIPIQGKDRATVVKSSPGLCGDVAAPPFFQRPEEPRVWEPALLGRVNSLEIPLS
jgi:hypothetical protein